jgi:hypothetical protein
MIIKVSLDKQDGSTVEDIFKKTIDTSNLPNRPYVMLNEYKGNVKVGDVYYIYWSLGNTTTKCWRKCKCIKKYTKTDESDEYQFEFYEFLDEQQTNTHIFEFKNNSVKNISVNENVQLFISENINSIAPGPSVPSTRLSTRGGKRTTKKKRPKQI